MIRLCRWHILSNYIGLYGMEQRQEIDSNILSALTYLIELVLLVLRKRRRFHASEWARAGLGGPLPVEDLCGLVRVEDEAGVVASEHSHDAQTQASGVAARQTGGLQQELGLH